MHGDVENVDQRAANTKKKKIESRTYDKMHFSTAFISVCVHTVVTVGDDFWLAIYKSYLVYRYVHWRCSSFKKKKKV